MLPSYSVSYSFNWKIRLCLAMMGTPRKLPLRFHPALRCLSTKIAKFVVQGWSIVLDAPRWRNHKLEHKTKSLHGRMLSCIWHPCGMGTRSYPSLVWSSLKKGLNVPTILYPRPGDLRLGPKAAIIAHGSKLMPMRLLQAVIALRILQSLLHDHIQSMTHLPWQQCVYFGRRQKSHFTPPSPPNVSNISVTLSTTTLDGMRRSTPLQPHLPFHDLYHKIGNYKRFLVLYLFHTLLAQCPFGCTIMSRTYNA